MIKLLLHEKRKYNLPQTISSKEKKSLEKNIPIQYIIGYIEFMNTIINVNNNVLIPRYETMELVDLVINKYAKPNQRILDLCTGSGFIGLSIFKNVQNINLVMSDISYKALKVAKTNMKLNIDRISRKRIKLKHSNLFQDIKGKFDLIISNPPYLWKKDQDIQLSVKQNEPSIALYSPKNGWRIYENIINEYKKYLKPGGKLILEINPKHIQKWNSFSEIDILKDINGKDRFIIINK
ncbi:peptide chain release factor N(5)-glutamine methyltransferase [Mycoplasma sp. Mirounga ES2805-ORL]|nr:peptide chain release factor N(5)-glutamine methyltransferase [Mycoplasma sp. Mirounga ES2805-ORL]